MIAVMGMLVTLCEKPQDPNIVYNTVITTNRKLLQSY